MEARSMRGESTDAIVMDDSPTDERGIQEPRQRWVAFSCPCIYQVLPLER